MSPIPEGGLVTVSPGSDIAEGLPPVDLPKVEGPRRIEITPAARPQPEAPAPLQEWETPAPTVEQALVEKARARKVEAARQTLDELAPPEEPAEPIEVPPAPKKPEEPPGKVRAVAKDLAIGATEAPRQVLGGARDAVQSMIDLADWIVEKARTDPGSLAIGEAEAAPAGQRPVPPPGAKPELPTVKPAKTVTGGIVRGVSQFLTSFVAAGGAMGGAMASVPAARAVVQGALASFVGFDPRHDRLANLVESFPKLKNPVTAYLAAQPGDGEAEGRFKNALEGAGLGVLAEGLFKAVRAIRDARRAAAAADSSSQVAAAEVKPREAAPLDLLGDQNAPLTAPGVRPEAKPAGASLAQGLAQNEPAAAGGALRQALGGEGAGEALGEALARQEKPAGAALRQKLDAPPEARLPADLAGPTRFTFQGERFTLNFARDLEKALLITSQARKSARDADYRAWLKARGYTDEEIATLGKEVRDKVKAQAAKAEPGELAIGELVADKPPTTAATHASGRRPPELLLEEPADLGVPSDVVARGISGAAADQALAEEMAGGLARTIRAEVNPEGMTPLGAGEVYVNFSRINSPADVKRVIQDTAEAFKGDIDAARRGVRSNAQTVAAAGAEDAWKLLAARRQGQPMNAEQSLAARNLWEASAQKLMDIAQYAAHTPSPENLYQFRQMLAVHQAIQAEVIAARTETARALQSWSIPAGGGGAERLQAIENVLATFGGTDASALLARKVASLRSLPDGMSVLGKVTERGPFAKSLGVIKEIWINSLLGNFKTHVVNNIGNLAGAAVELVERGAAAGWSQAIGSGQIAPMEAAAKAYAVGRGANEGIRLFGRALRTGESQFGADSTRVDVAWRREISAENFNLPVGSLRDPRNWLGRSVDALGTVVNMPVRFLNAEDDFFKAVGYRMELHALSWRQATREVQDGVIPKEGLQARIQELVDHPPENLRLDAFEYAKYQTYTQEPGNFVAALNRMDRKWTAGSPGEQIGALALRFLIPFRNTPANLTKYAFERTPLAPLMSRYREAIARGGADADIARTRMALGTTAMLALIDQALDGNITGGGPKGDDNKGTLDTLRRTGWQPYSIKVGNRYFDYKRTDPFGTMIGVAADIAEIVSNANLDEDKQQALWQVMAAAAASYGNLLMDKTYMSSTSDFLDVLHNPGKAPGWLQRRASAFVPGSIRETRRQVDPYARWTSGMVDAMKDSIPGLSSSLPMARDVWGRPRTFQSGLGTLYDAISPIASKVHNPQPIDKEAIANDFNLGMPSWTISFGKQVNVSMRNRPEAMSRFLELRGQIKPSRMDDDLPDRATIAASPLRELTPAGQLIKKYGDKPLLDLLNDMIDGKDPRLSPIYAAASGGRHGGRDEIVKKIVSDYSRAAKFRLVTEFPEIAGVIGRKKANK